MNRSIAEQDYYISPKDVQKLRDRIKELGAENAELKAEWVKALRKINDLEKALNSEITNTALAEVKLEEATEAIKELKDTSKLVKAMSDEWERKYFKAKRKLEQVKDHIEDFNVWFNGSIAVEDIQAIINGEEQR